MRTTEALKHAAADGKLLSRLARDIEQTYSPNSSADIAILIDGSAYSPSWRAMNGGSQVWDAGIGELCEVYEEMLDEIMDLINDEIAGSIAWDEGCIFWYGPDYDHEELA